MEKVTCLHIPSESINNTDSSASSVEFLELIQKKWQKSNLYEID